MPSARLVDRIVATVIEERCHVGVTEHFIGHQAARRQPLASQSSPPSRTGADLFVSLRQYGGEDGIPLWSRSSFAGLIDLESDTTLYYVCACAGVALHGQPSHRVARGDRPGARGAADLPEPDGARESGGDGGAPGHALGPLDACPGVAPVPPAGGEPGRLGRELSGGEQQMLAIGRALMTNPDLLILDEATEGLAPLIRAEIWQCLIDKNVAALLALADRHHLLEKGRIVWRASSAELAARPELQHAHLGV
jgi:branched-chain amino acid transport system ATP-binding protein